MGKDLLASGCRWNINRGNLARIWEDKWVPFNENFKISSPKSMNCNLVMVADLIDNCWKMHTLKDTFSDGEVDLISRLPISFHEDDHVG